MVAALILVVVVLASIAFHLLSPWWMTPIASNWGEIDTTTLITFWITGVGFSAVVLFMAYCVFRFRHRAGVKAEYNPESKKLETWLAVVTAAAVAGMLAPGLIVWNRIITPPADAAQVEIIGVQWQWSYRLPGKDGRLGSSDPRFVSSDNPLGLDPNDLNGRDDIIITGDDLHLPVGKPVKVLLRSIDVVHNFYVPEFRVKMDLLPGMVGSFWFIPTKTGSFEALCAAFCGIAHPYMRSKVVVQPESEYQAWLQTQQTFAQKSSDTINASSGAVKINTPAPPG